MKIIAMIQIMVLAIGTVSAQSSDYYFVTAERLNIRSGPGKDYPINSTLRLGDSVLISRQVSGWAEIVADGEIVGYSALNFLSREKKVSKSIDQPKKEDSTGYGLTDYLAWIIIIAFFWVIYKIMNFFGFYGSGSDDQSVSNLYWYYCKDCGTLIKKNSKPDTLNCRVNRNHRWMKLARVGDMAYMCRDCHIQIYSTEKPALSECNINGMHRWYKL